MFTNRLFYLLIVSIMVLTSCAPQKEGDSNDYPS